MSQRLSMPPIHLNAVTRPELRAYFVNAWQLYEDLFGTIQDDAHLYQNPDPLRHPLIFYLGHNAAFYINKLRMAGLIDKGINESFERLFSKGVDPSCAAELERFCWPTVEEVRAFRREVFSIIANRIETLDLDGAITPEHPAWSLMMGIEHDRIHWETSSVLFRQAPVEVFSKPAHWSYAPVDADAPKNEFLYLDGGEVQLGKPSSSDIYGWDNEYGALTGRARAFEMTRNLITNSEFLAFVQDGGYRREDLWTAEGWKWVQEFGVQAPRFWVAASSGFQLRVMFDHIDLPMSWPAEVNWLEAMAYCRWKGGGARLPTEVEFTLMTQDAPRTDGDAAFFPGYNLHLRYFSPSPVGLDPSSRTQRGFNDAYGNVWQWLADDFYPLPGFSTHYLYEDFSSPYFDPEHSMMLGGSWASNGTSASQYYRLWFRRYFAQHAGFRMARDCA